MNTYNFYSCGEKLLLFQGESGEKDVGGKIFKALDETV